MTWDQGQRGGVRKGRWIQHARVLTCLVLGALAVAVSACGSSGTSGSTNQANLPPYMRGLSGVIHFNQSGGELQQGFDKAFVDDFEKLTGVKVIYSSPQGSMAKLKAMHDSGNMQWDLMELPGPGNVLEESRLGLLERFNYKGINTKGLPKSMLSPWGYDYGPSASMLIWNTDKWPLSGKHPTSVLDIFNTKDFPGKRCLYGASPEANGILEYGAMQGGVSRDHVYPINVDLALSELSNIKDDVVWWQSGAESIQFLLDGQCDMATTWNGRPALRLKEDPSLPVAGTFNDAMIGGGWFAVPKGAPNAKAAQALMRYYLQRKVQVAMCNAIAYCMPLPGVQSQLDPVMKKWTPLGANLRNTFPEDGRYWSTHLESLTPKWNSWLAQG